MSLKTKILRSFGQFNSLAAQARDHYTSALLARCYSALPWLFEGVVGRAAPGTGSQMVMSQDHGNQGGRPLPRNLVWGGDIGWGDQASNTRVAMFYQYISGGDVGQWIDITKDLAEPLGSMTHCFDGDVPPGIDSEETANDGNDVGLVNYMVVVVNQPTTLGAADFKLVNKTTGAEQILTSVESGAQTVTPTLSLTDTYYAIDLTDVPCIGGTRNYWMLQVRSAVAAYIWVESSVGTMTRARSGPKGQGTNQLRNLTF